jgi:hypothetical protein
MCLEMCKQIETPYWEHWHNAALASWPFCRRDRGQRGTRNVRRSLRSTQHRCVFFFFKPNHTSLVPVLLLCAITRWTRVQVKLNAHEGLSFYHLLQHAACWMHLWTSSQRVQNTLLLSRLVSYNEEPSTFWNI